MCMCFVPKDGEPNLDQHRSTDPLDLVLRKVSLSYHSFNLRKNRTREVLLNEALTLQRGHILTAALAAFIAANMATRRPEAPLVQTTDLDRRSSRGTYSLKRVS